MLGTLGDSQSALTCWACRHAPGRAKRAGHAPGRAVVGDGDGLGRDGDGAGRDGGRDGRSPSLREGGGMGEREHLFQVYIVHLVSRHIVVIYGKRRRGRMFATRARKADRQLGPCDAAARRGLPEPCNAAPTLTTTRLPVLLVGITCAVSRSLDSTS